MNCALFRTLLCILLGAGPAQSIQAAEQGKAVPKRGGTFRVSFPSDLRSLDPAIAYDNVSVPLCKMQFRGLLNFDDGVNLVPDQAKDWSISPDGRTYTFHLRPGVRFGHGRPVEAADYVFTFERMLDAKLASPGQTFFLGIRGAAEFVAGKATHVIGLKAPDPETFIVELVEPQFTFRYVLAMTFAGVVPREVVQREGANFQYHLVGTGPYQLAQWKRGVRWQLVRNPHYTGADGNVDGIDIMIGADSTTATMMLERGEIDLVLASPADAMRFQRDPARRDWLLPVDTASMDYLFMNTEMKPFDDIRVRQAVRHAVNKERLVKLTGGFSTVARGIVPPALSWTNNLLPLNEYDPPKARALLQEAGFPDGLKTELSYIVTTPVFARLAEAVQQDLREAGIDAELKPLAGTTFIVKASSRRQIPFGIWGWFQDYPDPSNFLDVLFNGERITETDCHNAAFYNNPAVNRLFHAAATNMDAQVRTKLLKEAEAHILQDAPGVPLVCEQYPVLLNPRVRGNLGHPVWLLRYESVWLDP